MNEIDILLVEDNPGDVRLIQQAFDERNLPGTLHVVQTGGAALDRLLRRGEFEADARPDLVILDLNLPATSGHTVLEEIDSDPRLQRMPVVILTGSRTDDHLCEVYDGGANACLTKPVDPDEFADLVQLCAEFWDAVTLPPDVDTTDGG